MHCGIRGWGRKTRLLTLPAGSIKRANVHSLLNALRLKGRGTSVMRRANAQLQSDRRAEILAAAQRCFVRSGFHGASMQEICAEAGMSPGNLYRYFPSKEALIAGIAERDRAEVGAAVRAAPTSRTASSPCSKAWRSITSRSASASRCCCAPRSWRRAAAIPRSPASLRAFDADVQKLARRPAARGGRARRHSRRRRFRRRRHHADGDRRRRVVAPRARSRLQRRSRAADLHGHHAPHAARPPAKSRSGDKSGASNEESAR